MIFFIINFFIIELFIQLVVVEVEDGYWMDENSWELFIEFVCQLSCYLIVVVLIFCYFDDGFKLKLLEFVLLEQYRLFYIEVDLNILIFDVVQEFVELCLGGIIYLEFLDILLWIFNSNFFYLEQMLEYFVEWDLLVQEGGCWIIYDKDVKFFSFINVIFIVCIDWLSELVKEIVKVVVVIGCEFDIFILM